VVSVAALGVGGLLLRTAGRAGRAERLADEDAGQPVQGGAPR